MKICKNITGWTDYPVPELGDIYDKEAPIRRMKVLSYDGDKYAWISIIGTDIELSVKAGYQG